MPCPGNSQNLIKYQYLGLLVIPGRAPCLQVNGISEIDVPEERYSGIEQCLPCGDQACVQDGYVKITRKLDDNGCPSPFQIWLDSKKRGTLDIQAIFCNKSTSFQFTGYACKLERGEVEQCQSGVLKEVLTIKLSEEKNVAAPPSVLPRCIQAKFNKEKSTICFQFTLVGGNIDDAAVVSIFNQVPCESYTWSLKGGPADCLEDNGAPGSEESEDVHYVSPDARYFKATMYDKTGFDNKPLLNVEDKSDWNAVYDELQNQTQLAVKFVLPSGTELEQCIDVQWPPRPSVKPIKLAEQ
jgi:hypothetical protein